MILSEVQKASDQLQKDLNVLTNKFCNASGKNERRRLLSSMTTIMEELHKIYGSYTVNHTL